MNLIQVAQRVTDLERASSFYAKLLTASPIAHFEPPGLVFFDVGSVRLLLDRAVPSALLYFEVEDVRSHIEQLRADGVAIETEPHVIFSHSDDSLGPAGTDEWMAFILDSEGNTVGLISRNRAVDSV